MNVLLDTCALLALPRGELPAAASKSLRTAEDAWVSVVSAWEVAIKAASGRISLPQPPIRWFLAVTERYQLRELPLDASIACAAAALPRIHRDPFDRVLVALAQAKALTLLTSDKNIAKYPGTPTLW